MSFEFVRELEDFYVKCRESLLTQENIKHFFYPRGLHNKEISVWSKYVSKIENDLNNEEILKTVSGKDGIYVLFERIYNEAWILKYIGGTTGEGARKRLRNHLITVSSGTRAKLEYIKKSVFDGNDIGISFVEIEPGSLRHTIEELLIKKLSPEWNINGKKGKHK